MRRAAILQSAYIPWRGYFDLIASVDSFVFYDDVQFSHGDWRNRNRIRTSHGVSWLTIPVPKKHRIRVNICDVTASATGWAENHWRRIVESYRKAPYFFEVAEFLEPLFAADRMNLSEINFSFIRAICDYLGIVTPLSWSWDYESSSGKTQRLIDLCHAARCDTYVSGPAAKSYLDESAFWASGIAVEWFSYDQLRPYPQIHGDFEPAVSIIDLLMNCGPLSRNHLPSLAEKVRTAPGN